ncbi:MAG: hypothetical protein JXQ80_12730 [Bacteroidales bacterium]|nr:hypothetical protein [Bacteroidales bacterium]
MTVMLLFGSPALTLQHASAQYRNKHACDVGGEHSIDVDWHEFRKLLFFLKAHEQAIWVAPLVEMAPFISPGR